MGTTADKLEKIRSTKESIKESLMSLGVEITDTDTFASYASRISELPIMYVSNSLPDSANDGDYCILINS